MKSVVITGSTRGLGYGLAEAFLDRGCSVVVNGRTDRSVGVATATLARRYGPEQIIGVSGDIADYNTARLIWDSAESRFNRVDIWINNAGMAPPVGKIWEVPPDNADGTIDININGVIHGCQVAMAGMIKQGYGQIYNVEGLGSKGEMRPRTTIYGTSKYATDYFTRALIKEAKGTPVQVGSISPGIVITDLLRDQFVGREADFDKAKRMFNILGDQVDTVAPWIVTKVMNNNRHAARFVWLTRAKAFGRFLTAPFTRRNFYP